VSGREVALRVPRGSDDLFVHEAYGSAPQVALLLARRLTRAPKPAGSGEISDERASFDCADLTVTDFEALLLHLHSALFGPRVECVIVCPQASCGAPLEISFRVGEYLADIRPRLPRGVGPDGKRASWFCLMGRGFRLPTIGDQVAFIGQADAVRRLTKRCMDPPGTGQANRGDIERAMAALAPEVSRALEGQCPECGNAVQALFHVPSFIVSELRRATIGIYDEVHRIAAGYHWSESAILAMPRKRRQRYAELVRYPATENGHV
jgi:hypothetical protein